MKHTNLTAAMLFILASPASVLAAEQVVQEYSLETIIAETEASLPAASAAEATAPESSATETIAPEASSAKTSAPEASAAEASAPGNPPPQQSEQTAVAMHKGGCKGGKDHDGMRHAGGKHGKGQGKHGKHAQVVRRLDMIEARLAKMEAMLESLMRRE